MPRKRRLFFKIARVVAMFVVGFAVAVFIALSQVNLETLRGDLLAVMRDTTGLPIEIDGSVSWKFSLRPKVEMNNIRVPNAEWAKHKNGLSAKKVYVTLNLISLLRDRPTIQNVTISDAVVFLEQNDQGEYSLVPTWEKKADAAPTKPSKYPFEDPGFGSVDVRDSVIYVRDNIYSLSGFNIAYMSQKDKREYNGWFKSGLKVYPFILSFSEYNAERKIYPVRIALSTGGEALVANVALEGTSKTPIDFVLTGTIPDLASLGKVVAIDMPQLPAMKLNISGGFDHKKLSLRKSSIFIKNSDLTVSSGTVDWSGKRTSVTAKINSKKIDISDIFPNLYGKKWSRPDRELNVFRNTPLFGDEILKYNIDLDANIDDLVTYRELPIKDINTKIKLKDGDIRIDASVKFAEGDVNTSVVGNILPDGIWDIRAAGIGERIYVGEIMNGVRVKDYLSELPVNLEFYLEGMGATLSELMGSLNGPVYAYSVAKGYAHSNLVSYMYGTDFLTTLRHNIQDLFTSKKKYNQITIKCAAVNVKLRNGKLETEHGVAVETNAINLRLAGDLDLGKEKMKLSLITTPVRGLKLSLSGSVVNAIEINGALAEPDVQINGSAVVGKVASATGIGLLLAPFTGGIGLVAGAGIGYVAGDLLENWLADDHPCKTAREKGAPGKRNDPEWLNMPMADLVNSVMKK